MSGRCARCSCFACRHGPSQRGYEPATVVDSGTGRGPGQATYVRTACFEGVTSGESAAGRPCEPSRLDLFALMTVDRGAWKIYPQPKGRRPVKRTYPDAALFAAS